MKLYTTDDERQAAEIFLDRYALQSVVVCPDEKQRNLKPRASHVCRFCGLQEPAATFRSVAHLMPQMLGNRHLIADCECDRCNEKFSGYENDLANFLGIARTVNGVSSGGMVPKYKSSGDQLMAEYRDFFSSENGEIFIRGTTGNSRVSIDAEKGTLVVPYLTRPYVPLKVYRSLLKMALSVLPEEEVDRYCKAISYLMERETGKQLTGANRVFMHCMTLGVNYVRPVALLFKKRKEDEAIFTHWFMLYFQNFVFQFFIPLCDADLHLYNTKVLVGRPPLFFTDPAPAEAAGRLGSELKLIDLSAAGQTQQQCSLNLYIGRERMIETGLLDKASGKLTISDEVLARIVALKVSRRPTVS